MENIPHDMHSVTDFVIDEKTSVSVDDLNAETIDEANELYSRTLIDVLTNADYVDTDLKGALSKVLHPSLEGKVFEGVALKLFDPDDAFKVSMLASYETLTPSEINEILQDTGFYLTDLDRAGASASEISELEKAFIYQAYEHRIYEKYFGKYVLPTVFVSCHPVKDILASDGTKIAEKDKPAFFTVQDFESGIRTIGYDRSTREQYTDWGTLTPQEVENISEFVDDIERVFLETGWFPDASLLYQGNMGLAPDGRVILIDSNAIFKEPPERVQIQKDLANRRISYGGIFFPIRKLRQQIEIYSKQQSHAN